MQSTAEPRPTSRPRWPTIRAVLIAAAIAVGLVDGAPIPTARVMDRLPPALRAVSAGLQDVQTALMVPFRPIKDLFMVSQRWSVFSTTGGARYRMCVEARGAADPTWTLLYRAQDP